MIGVLLVMFESQSALNNSLSEQNKSQSEQIKSQSEQIKSQSELIESQSSEIKQLTKRIETLTLTIEKLSAKLGNKSITVRKTTNENINGKGSERKNGIDSSSKEKKQKEKKEVPVNDDVSVTDKEVCKDSNIKVSANKQYLKIPNFGWVKLTEKLRFEGHINSSVISQHGDRFYASFNLEISEDEYKRTHKGNEANTEHTIVGIDVGLKAFITTDAGLFIQAPKPLKRLEQRLKRAQRVLSRRVHPKAKGDTTKCSNRYKKQRLYVSNLQRRIANIRKDYTHKVSSLLIRHYQYLSLESLRVQNMMKNHKLAKAIADVGFSAFKTQLLYKAQYNHRVVFEADTFFPSSKLCSNCGAIHKHLTLADRTYICPSCPDGKDCDLVCLIASPDDGNLHLDVIGRLSLILNDKDMQAKIRNATSASHLIELISNAEKALG